MLTILYKPDNLPSNIDANGIPILSPRLYKTCNIGKPIHNTTQGIIEHLKTCYFVENVLMLNEQQIAVKSVSIYDYSEYLIDKLFIEGVHTLSSKIWKATKYEELLTSDNADRILHQCPLLETTQSKKEFMVYVIDILN